MTSQDWVSNPWTLSELVETLHKLGKEEDLGAYFAFFIDGLDEYEGEYYDIIKVIQELAEHPNMKICASSRPYYAFKDAFGQASERQLILEDHTEDDIREYVELHFQKSQRFQKLRKLDVRHDEFIQEIVQKAQGVFLWVVLIVRSLLKGFTNADDIQDLQKRLRELPPTLEGVFRQMFDRIEPIYREQTAKIFQVALVTPKLSLMAVSFLNDNRSADIHAVEIEPLNPVEARERYETTCRRLAGRCDGLLEAPYKLKDWSEYFYAPVVFMHKSVRDFLLLKDMQAMLKKRSGLFDARETLCKAILAQMKSMHTLPQQEQGHDSPLESLFADLAYSARELEIQNNLPATVLLDEAEKVFRRHFTTSKAEDTAFLGLAVQRGLQLYVGQRLDVQPHLVRAGPMPLLYYALESAFLSYPPEQLSMVEMLLSRGASPEQKLHNKSVWCLFVERKLADKTIYPPIYRAKSLKVLRLLISHGANIDQDIFVGVKHPNGGTGRAADLHKLQEIPQYKTARKVMVEIFGQYEVDELLQAAPSRRRTSSISLLSWFGWK